MLGAIKALKALGLLRKWNTQAVITHADHPESNQEGKMALYLPGIGACPSSFAVLYSHYSPVYRHVSTEFLTTTEGDLRWVS
jgi:hypothetical protein